MPRARRAALYFLNGGGSWEGGRSRRRKALLTAARLARAGAWEVVPVRPQQKRSELATRANTAADVGTDGGPRPRSSPANGRADLPSADEDAYSSGRPSPQTDARSSMYTFKKFTNRLNTICLQNKVGRIHSFMVA